MKIFVTAKNIISSLGFTSRENMKAVEMQKTGVTYIDQLQGNAKPFYGAKINWEDVESRFSDFENSSNFTATEKLIILSVKDVISQNEGFDAGSPSTVFIISSTKGNIDLLEPQSFFQFDPKRILLWEMGEVITKYFKNPNKSIVISNACVSGVVAINLGKKLLEEDHYKTAVVVGVDILSSFIVSGFQSFKAISQGVCKPYDIGRDGINLGEACATIVLKKGREDQKGIQVLGGSSSNDANHISGPSRTGEGLFISIQKTLRQGNIKVSEIDYISGHGTATTFNDEMESIAISRAGLSAVPANSLKSYFGHTLGAAGVLESALSIHSLEGNMLIATFNYDRNGVSKPLNIIKKTTKKELKTCLKLAAGFGGSNASVLFQKV